jgi:hypothetical protein
MPKRPIHQREHAVGEVVLLKELSAINLPLQEGIQIENSCAAVSGMDRRTGFAKGVDAHFGFSVNVKQQRRKGWAVILRQAIAQWGSDPNSAGQVYTVGSFDVSCLGAASSKAELGHIFTRLCEQVASDLAGKGYEGKTIGIKLRYADFRSVTRDQTLDRYSISISIRHVVALPCRAIALSAASRLMSYRYGNGITPPTPAPYAASPGSASNVCR